MQFQHVYVVQASTLTDVRAHGIIISTVLGGWNKP